MNEYNDRPLESIEIGDVFVGNEYTQPRYLNGKELTVVSKGKTKVAVSSPEYPDRKFKMPTYMLTDID